MSCVKPIAVVVGTLLASGISAVIKFWKRGVTSPIPTGTLAHVDDVKYEEHRLQDEFGQAYQRYNSASGGAFLSGVLSTLSAEVALFWFTHGTTYAGIIALLSTLLLVMGMVYALSLCKRAKAVTDVLDKKWQTYVEASEVTPSKTLTPTLIEQYKAYLTDLGNIGSRQAQTNAWYVSILSALVAFSAYSAKEASADALSYMAVAAAAAVGLTLCMHWHNHAQSYQYLYNVKFTVLRQMELSGLPFPCYRREQRFMHPNRRRFTNLERSLTRSLAFPFLVLLLFAAWKLLVVWSTSVARVAPGT